MIGLHTIRHPIPERAMRAARALAQSYPTMIFRMENEEFTYQLRRTDAWVTMLPNDIDFWADQAGGPRATEEVTMERFQ